MITSVLKSYYRRITQGKGYFLINVLGLSICFASVALIFTWINYEVGFDRGYTDADNIYRIYPSVSVNGNDFTSSMAPPPLAEVMTKEFPEVIQATRIWTYTNLPIVNTEDDVEKIINEKNLYQADSNFFEIFSIPMVEGDPKTALMHPFSLVLTIDAARKYFSEEAYQNKQILGKTLMIVWGGAKFPCKITGITENVPQQSHFHYSVILSNVTDPWNRSTVWVDNTYYTYLRLRSDADPKAVENKLVSVVKNYLDPQLKQNFGMNYEQLVETGSHWDYKLQPLTDIHLNSHLEREIEFNGDIKNLYFLGIAAIFLIVMSAINYANLATSQSLQRAREIAIRKTLGASTFKLQIQVLAESALLNFVAVVVAVGLITLTARPFGELLGVTFPSSIITMPSTWVVIMLLFLILSVLGGIYPAYHLTSVEAVSAMKGIWSTGKKSTRIRSMLLVIQFSISIGLLIGACITYMQLKHLKGKSPGFDKDNILVLADPSILMKDKANTFIEKVKLLANVQSVSFCSHYPGGGENTFPVSVNTQTGDVDHILTQFNAGYDFMKTFNIPLTMGRDFRVDMDRLQRDKVILNESAVKELGLVNPIGHQIDTKYLNSLEIAARKCEVIGVVKDFNFESMHNAIRPMAIFLDEQAPLFTIRIMQGQTHNTVSAIEHIWKDLDSDVPFEFHFADQQMNTLYKSEDSLTRLLTLLTGLIFFVAIIGLLGLTSLMLEKRTKEIGVRKVLGASVPEVLFELSKPYTQGVITAFLISAPTTYWFMQQWLNTFSYRIAMPLWPFFLVGVFVLTATILVVGYIGMRRALQNPITSLRTD